MSDFRLTAQEFHALWSALELGDTPYPLDVPETDEDVRIDPELRREVEPWLRLVADHALAVDLVADVEGPMRALAASNGRAAVLAEVTEAGVQLTPIRATGLASALVSLLPDHDPGPGHALSVPVDALHQAAQQVDGTDDDFDDMPWNGGGAVDERSALAKAGISHADAALLAELTTSRVAGGQFGVSIKDDGRCPAVVTWFDTPQGRYLMVKDGAWLSIAPTDPARLTARVDRLLATAR